MMLLFDELGYDDINLTNWEDMRMENNYELEIIYQDDAIVVVDKPVGLAVHKNDFMPHDAPYVTKMLGDKLGKWIYNVHRLDAKTSGVMVLALSQETAHDLTLQFERRAVEKKYLAVVQGKPGDGEFNDPVLVKKQARFKKPAVTRFRTLQTVETNISFKEKQVVALSLVEVIPETGRWHQIRQHFARNRFDIVGDTHHGDFTLNKILTEKTGINRLLLHASSLRFIHPVTREQVSFHSAAPEAMSRMMREAEGMCDAGRIL